MVDPSRIDELRRRTQRDPASIAFAQLAEEYRRAGRFADAIETCRTGLAYHPGYLSAYVTLGRALVETGDLQAAAEALTRVHAAAPENLAAIKGLADIRHRLGERQESLALYRQALTLAPHDPELEHLIGIVSDELVERPPAPAGPPVALLASAATLEPAWEPLSEPAWEPLGEPAWEPLGEPAAQPPEDVAPGTAGQVEALERWLDTILADRDSRR